MRDRGSSKFFASGLLLACLVLLAAGPARVSAQAPVNSAGGSKVVLVPFVSTHGGALANEMPGKFRRIASRSVARAVERAGHRVVEGYVVESSMRKWRIRSPLNLPPGFVEELSREHGADAIMVTHLNVFPRGMVLYGRLIGALSSRLLWTGVAESRLDRERALVTGPDGDWKLLLYQAAVRFGQDCPTSLRNPGGKALVVLPSTILSKAQAQVDLWNSCFLAALLEQDQWSLLDPGVLSSLLMESGHDPRKLGKMVRELIADGETAPNIVLVGLVPYKPQLTSSAIFLEDDGISQFDRGFRDPYYCYLRVIDGETGFLFQAFDTYLEDRGDRGMFGVVRDPPWSDRFRESARNFAKNLKMPQEDE